MAKCIMKVREVKRPISEDVIGLRLVAAIPNMAGQFRGRVIPSYAKPYFITESSDMPELTLLAVKNMQAACRWAGYDEFDPQGALAEFLAANT